MLSSKEDPTHTCHPVLHFARPNPAPIPGASGCPSARASPPCVHCCAGEPIRVKSKDLPLHWFDLLFRRTGAALAFCLCAARATATLRLARPRGPGSLRHVEVLWPVGIYALQTLVRGAIYWLHAAGEERGGRGVAWRRRRRALVWLGGAWSALLRHPQKGCCRERRPAAQQRTPVAGIPRARGAGHTARTRPAGNPTHRYTSSCAARCPCRARAGYILSPRRYARDNLDHPPHVMSDHILLGASVHAALACEAAMALPAWAAAAAAGELGKRVGFAGQGCRAGRRGRTVLTGAGRGGRRGRTVWAGNAGRLMSRHSLLRQPLHRAHAT